MKFCNAVESTYKAIKRGKAATAAAAAEAVAGGGSSFSSSAAAAASRATLPAAPSAAVFPALDKTAVVASAPWEQDIGAFGELTLGDLECALSANHAGLFSIVAKFPTLTALARGGLLGLAAEATSDRTLILSTLGFSSVAAPPDGRFNRSHHGRGPRNASCRCCFYICSVFSNPFLKKIFLLHYTYSENDTIFF